MSETDSHMSTTQTKLAKVEIKVENIEKNLQRLEGENQRLWEKMDENTALLLDIKAHVQNKDPSFPEIFKEATQELIKYLFIAVILGLLFLGGREVLKNENGSVEKPGVNSSK